MLGLDTTTERSVRRLPHPSHQEYLSVRTKVWRRCTSVPTRPQTCPSATAGERDGPRPGL